MVNKNILLLIVVVFLVVAGEGVSAANRLQYENFDDQEINPTTANFTYIQCSSWRVLQEETNFTWATGRDGTGSAIFFRLTDDMDSCGLWNYGGGAWPTDELYFSYWIRHPDFVSHWGHENMKISYFYMPNSLNYISVSIVNTYAANYAAQAGGSTCFNTDFATGVNLLDGAWHKVEWYANFATGVGRFWIDGDLKINHSGCSAWPGTVYYIAGPSIDAQETSEFSRQIDDVEIWDGMPSANCTVASNCEDRECNTKDCVSNVCVYTPVVDGTSCTDDGLFCDGVETCQIGSCVSSGSSCVNDGYACSVDCDEIIDSCSITYNDVFCDDSDVCTDDSCVGVGGDATTGCSNTYNTNPCNDGISCTETDSCSGGNCSGTPNNALCLPLPSGCTSTTCDSSLGCDYLPQGCAFDCSGLVLLHHYDSDVPVVTDYSGYGNDGIVNGATFISPGKFSGAFDFDGNDYIENATSLSPSLRFSDYPFTLSAWINTQLTVDRYSFDMADANSSSRNFAIGVSGGYGSLFARNGVFSSITGSNRIVNDSAWHSVIGVFRSAIDRELFVDGVSDGISTTSITFFTPNRMRIGMLADQTPSNSFVGEIDEVAIWNRALSSSEISQIYTSGVPITCGASSCGSADSNTDGSVSITEIMSYITQWKSGSVTITALMTGIGEWKNGC